MAGKDDEEKPSGIFGMFFGQKKRLKKAHMGDGLNMYFNAELKCWVEKGKEHEVQAGGVPPPPPRPSARKTEAAAGEPADNGAASGTQSRYAVAGGVARAPSKGSLVPPINGLAASAQSGAAPPKFFVPPPVVPSSDAANAEGDGVASEAAPARVFQPRRASSDASQANADVSAASPATNGRGHVDATPRAQPQVPPADFSAHESTISYANGVSDGHVAAQPFDGGAVAEAALPQVAFEHAPENGHGLVNGGAAGVAGIKEVGWADVANGGQEAYDTNVNGEALATEHGYVDGDNGVVPTERPSFAPSYEMISVNSQSELAGQSETAGGEDGETQPDYSTWDMDVWSKLYEEDPRAFYHHFFYSKQQEGWTAEDWARYEAEESVHYSWLTYYLNEAQGNNGAAGYQEAGAQEEGWTASADGAHDAQHQEFQYHETSTHSAAVDTLQHAAVHDATEPAPMDAVAERHDDAGAVNGADARDQAHADGAAEAGAAEYDETPLGGQLDASGLTTASEVLLDEPGAGWAGSGVAWVDPDAAADLHRSAQLLWVDPEDVDGSPGGGGHAVAVAELAGEFSDDESLFGAVAPASVRAGQLPSDKAKTPNGERRSPRSAAGTEDARGAGSSRAGSEADDSMSWAKGSVSQAERYAGESLGRLSDHYGDGAHHHDRTSEHESTYAGESDVGVVGGRTEAASSEADRGAGSCVSDAGHAADKVYAYQHSMGSSVNAQAPSVHAPSEVLSEMPDGDGVHLAPPYSTQPLYHNSVIPEVTEMGPMDEPHEVPVLPPMHTEVEPTDRQFYTVHDVAQLEESRRRPGSMSVDVEIASTAAQSDTGSQTEQRFSGAGSLRGTGGAFGPGAPGAAPPGGSPTSGSDHGQDAPRGGGAVECGGDGAAAAAAGPPDQLALNHLAALMVELQGALGGAAAAAGDGLDVPLQQRLRELEDRSAGLLDELSLRKLVQVEQPGTITPNYSHLSTPLKSEGGWNATTYASPGAMSSVPSPPLKPQDTLQLRLRQQGAPDPSFHDTAQGSALQQLQQQLLQSDASLAELAAENATLAERLSASDAELAARDEHIAVLESQLASLQHQLEAAQSQAASSSNHQQVAALQQQLEDQQAAFDELRQDHEDLLACLGQEAAKVEALADELRRFGGDVDSLIAQVEETTGFENDAGEGEGES